MIQTNPYWFLCLSQPQSGPKEYTITAWDEQRSLSDHTILISHKNELRPYQRKDLGNTMQLIRLVPNQITLINERNDMSDWCVRTIMSILSRYQWYDESTDTIYYFIPKLTGQKLIDRLNSMDFFCDRYETKIIDEKKWWLHIPAKLLQITKQESTYYILGEFFGLCFLYGKPTITKEVFSAFKIQIPILRFEIVEYIERIVDQLRSYHFVLNASYNESQQVYEITTNDYDLLAYIRILYGNEWQANLVDKILDLQKEIFIQYGISADQKAMRWKIYEVRR